MGAVILAVSVLFAVALGIAATAELFNSRKQTDHNLSTVQLLRAILEVLLAFFYVAAGFALSQVIR